MKYEISIEKFIEIYWQDEFDKLFKYIFELKDTSMNHDRMLTEINTEVHNTVWENFEVNNYVQILWVWVNYVTRLSYLNNY